VIFSELHEAMQAFAETVIANLMLPLPLKQVMVNSFPEDGQATGSAVVVGVQWTY
jgi:hypothetical protein